ncbi:MAG: NUDIX domain-containing protein [Ferruginibacter sp.]
MPKKSAGILLYRFRENLPELFLVHPGGPFWAKKDLGAWSIPKGELNEEEDPLEAAKREFEEETGVKFSGNFIELTPVKQKGGKLIFAWALRADIDAAKCKSNSFEIEWPPRSGKMKQFPEVDKFSWFSVEDANEKLLEGQRPLIAELLAIIHLSTY